MTDGPSTRTDPTADPASASTATQYPDNGAPAPTRVVPSAEGTTEPSRRAAASTCCEVQRWCGDTMETANAASANPYAGQNARSSKPAPLNVSLNDVSVGARTR